MRLEFTTSLTEHQEAAWVHRRKHPDREDRFKPLRIVGYAATALGVLLLGVRPDGGGRVGPLALIVTGMFIPLRLIAIAHAHATQYWAESERLMQPTTWIFSETVQVISTMYEVTYQWGMFLRWFEGPTVFLLYQTESQYRVVPKRAFVSQAEMTEFRRMLTERIVPPSIGFPISPVGRA